MRITPVKKVASAFNNLKSIIKNRRQVLKKPPFSEGDRVECIGFEGKTYLGSVVDCKEFNNGYVNFMRVQVRLDLRGIILNINWSLFPYKIKKVEE